MEVSMAKKGFLGFAGVSWGLLVRVPKSIPGA